MATDTDRLLLQLDADITRLTKQMAKASGETTKSLKTIEHEAESSMLRLEALFGKTKVGEALENVFKRTRFTVLEEGSARIPVFGSALEALGPAGLIAAGGLFAFHEAMEKAKEAGEWAEGLEHSAGKLGVSMQKLQELDFAGASIGLKPEETRESLDGVNDLLGKMQAGEPRAKILMQELSFTPAQVQSFKTVADFLPALADHLSKAGSAAEQANIADKGGFAKLMPLLRGGADGLDRLADEARKAGIILGDDTVRGAAELSGKLNELEALMQGDLRRAFIDLMPIGVQLAGVFAEIAREAADAAQFVEKIADVKAPGDLIGQQAQLKGRIAALQNPTVGGFLTNRHDAMDMLSEGGRPKKIAELQDQLREVNDQVKEQLQAGNVEGGPPARTLITPKAKKPKAGPHDETADFDKSATDAYDQALKEAASAMGALVKDITAHAEIEKRAVDDEAAKKLADLSAQEVKIRASKNDAHRAEQIALIEKAKTETQNAAAAKKELIDRQAATAAVSENVALQDEINSALSHVQDIRASLAMSTSDRDAITKKNLLDNQQRARLDFDQKANDDLSANAALPSDQQNHALAGEIDQRRQAMMESQAADRDQLTNQQLSPWDQWMQSGVKAGNDVGQTFQTEAVKGITDFNSELTESIVQGKSLGSIMHGVFQSLESDVIQYLLKQAEVGMLGGGQGLAAGLFGTAAPQASAAAAGTSTGLLGSLISLLPHFAAGTDDAPGGLSLVGEKGPELVNLPGGAGVTPNNVLSSIGKMNPSAMQRSTSNQTVNFDLRGAVMTEELLRQANAYSEQVGQGAFAGAVGVSRQVVPADLSRRSAQSFIR